MQKIGIIGTAGRKDDQRRMNQQVYDRMFKKVRLEVADNLSQCHDFCLVSGGAAFADHIAVDLFLQGYGKSLTLYLPAEWDSQEECYVRGPGDKYRDPGQIANYYHRLFSEKVGYDTLAQIEDALARGAELIYIPGGFKARNLKVGQVDWLIALTWGEGDTPKDGGTSHTWSHSSAPRRTHIPLHTL